MKISKPYEALFKRTRPVWETFSETDRGVTKKAISVTAQILAKCILRQMLAEHVEDEGIRRNVSELSEGTQMPEQDNDTGSGEPLSLDGGVDATRDH